MKSFQEVPALSGGGRGRWIKRRNAAILPAMHWLYGTAPNGSVPAVNALGYYRPVFWQKAAGLNHAIAARVSARTVFLPLPKSSLT